MVSEDNASTIPGKEAWLSLAIMLSPVAVLGWAAKDSSNIYRRTGRNAVVASAVGGVVSAGINYYESKKTENYVGDTIWGLLFGLIVGFAGGGIPTLIWGALRGPSRKRK